MIQITTHLVDFMESTSISDADVGVIVQVVPRWKEVISPDLENDRSSNLAPAGGPKTILLPRTDLAEEFQQQGRTNADGAFRSSFNVASAFRRLRQLIVDGSKPDDVVAFVTVRISCAGLERVVQFGSLTAKQGAYLLDENADIEPVVVIDFAKAIVGHTTTNSTTLWFNLHQMIRPGDRFTCQVQQISPQPSNPATRTFPVAFNATRANTAILNVSGLQPATTYTFRLLCQDRSLTRGQFTTAPSVTGDRFSFVFGSCHLPTKSEESLERWKILSRRENYDFMVLLGDQIYGDEIERMGLGSTWFERYVNRYHQLWTYQPMRDVLRNTPTYMVFDDHEVVDDWGVVEIPSDRLNDALSAYRIFQQSHNPGGYNGSFHYNFRWGPASFFVMDNRSARRIPPQNQDYPILGQQQWEAIQAWARDPATLASDIIFFIAPVPIAFLPVEEVRRLIEELKDEAKDTGIIAGFLAGAVVGGIPGGIAGAILGGYAGHEVAESKIEEKGLADLTSRDLADMWTYEPNQKDLVRVLNCLFNLANDIQPDGRPGSRPRAVFVLGGDVHSGSMHAIRSNRTNSADHRRNPLIYQVTSSAISHDPATDKTYEQVVRHIQDGLSFNELDLVKAGFDAEQLIKNVVAGKPAKFVLDSKREKVYAAEFVDLLVDRNFGQITIERVRADRRVYHIYMFVEGQHKTLQRAIELDLDAAQVKPKELFGVLLATEGKVTFLRVNDIGTGYGPGNDRLDVEVVIQLDSEPNRAFGFQLRNDANQKTHRRMLDILRDAFKRDRRIQIDYIRTGLRNGQILRVVELNLN